MLVTRAQAHGKFRQPEAVSVNCDVQVEFQALTALLKDRSRRAAAAGAGRTGLKTDPGCARSRGQNPSDTSQSVFLFVHSIRDLLPPRDPV